MTVAEKVTLIVDKMKALTQRIDSLNSQILNSSPQQLMQIIDDLNNTADEFISIDRKRSSLLDTIQNLKLGYHDEWPFK